MTDSTPERGHWLGGFQALLLWSVIGLLTVVFSLAMAVCAACLWIVDRRRKTVHWLACLWGRTVFWGRPSWQVTVTGRDHIESHRRYVLVANHQSLLDIMALCHLNRQFKWVVKDELFRVPFLGWAMALAGYVKLVRGQPRSIRDAYDRARQWLASGVSVLFFPEGTRSRTGELGAFKNGAFKLAVASGASVVPIAVSGTHALLVKGGWRFRPGPQHVRVDVLPPIAPTISADKLRDEARSRILQALERRA